MYTKGSIYLKKTEKRGICMALMKPFKAIRPKEELSDRIAALPYDVYNREEAKKEVKREPLSFLRIDRAETLLEDTVDTYDASVYQKAHDELWCMVRNGSFIQDAEACYYIYELEMNGRAQTGIVACASVDDYLNGVIMKHENTREDKELDRIRHVSACEAQTGPIFLTYEANRNIDRLVEQVKKAQAPIYEFEAIDGVIHKAWKIDQKDKIDLLSQEFQKINQIYIADGHHRCASAVKVALKQRELDKNQGIDGKEKKESDYFLSVIFPHNQLKILDYNRVIKDLNGYTRETILKELSKWFILVEKGKNPFKPSKRREFGMYLEDTWYALRLREAYEELDVVQGLDVSILQNLVLNPLFGIKDPKTDKRIDFIGGIRGLTELEDRVHRDCKIAFAMYPTSIEELIAVANEHKLMPPKSTWFEPKLRSGLFIHDIRKK